MDEYQSSLQSPAVNLHSAHQRFYSILCRKYCLGLQQKGIKCLALNNWSLFFYSTSSATFRLADVVCCTWNISPESVANESNIQTAARPARSTPANRYITKSLSHQAAKVYQSQSVPLSLLTMVTEVRKLRVSDEHLQCPQYEQYIIPDVLEKLDISVVRIQEEWQVFTN